MLQCCGACCLAAVCGATTDKLSLSADRKEVDHCVQRAPGIHWIMKLWGGGDLIRSANQRRFQVAEHLDQRSVRSTWMVRERGGWEQREERKTRHGRYAAVTHQRLKIHFCNMRDGVESSVFYSDDDASGGQDIHGGWRSGSPGRLQLVCFTIRADVELLPDTFIIL